MSDKRGTKLSTISKANKLASKMINTKMTRSYPVSVEFFVGAVVAKRFSGEWFLGKVDGVDRDENEALWHVTYSDFDGEDLDKGQLAACLVYHPELEADHLAEELKLGSFVWFSEDQQPRLGKILAVEPSSPRPIIVEIYAPQANAVSLPKAKFAVARDQTTGEAKLTKITMHQVQLKFKALTARGFLTAGDRRRLTKCLS